MVTFVLAGGCFWCLDAVFRALKGVSSSVAGYCGDSSDAANYFLVASGKTDHAESVRVTFDESIISAEIILDIFFSIHNPTTLDRQGADVGRQYRSAMFFSDKGQKETFEAAINRARTAWGDPIVTELSQLEDFFEAEPEHQNYYSNNPDAAYCSIILDPKIIKIRQKFTKWLKGEAV